jgi:hypothetical protein
VQNADIENQERAYRRGVVLGLTMAEVMTLVIFALLLVLTALVLARQKQIAELQARTTHLTAELAAALPPGVDHQKIEDIFRQLELAKQNAATLKSAQARVAELEERSKQNDRLKQAVSSVGDPSAPDTAQKVAESLKLGALVADLAAKAGISTLDPSALAALLAHVKDAEATYLNLRGQVANLQLAMRASGKGTVYPPCWADEATGKPEYIFDVSITSSGIVVRDNAIPHRSADEANLPIQAIKFGERRSGHEFVSETRALFDWSNRQDPVCRFFVRLFDITKDSEKTTFKTGQRAVEASFYKLPIDNVADAPQ